MALRLAERLEKDRRRVALVGPPTGTRLEQCRPGDADEQDREITREIGDVLYEVEERRLGPVDVVHHENEGPRSRECLKQPAEGPGGLLARPSSRAAKSERLGHTLGDQSGFLVPCESGRDRRRWLLAGVQSPCARNLPDNFG
jgi:hypothetical protein